MLLAIDNNNNIFFTDQTTAHIYIIYHGGNIAIPLVDSPTPGNIYPYAGTFSNWGNNPDPQPGQPIYNTSLSGINGLAVDKSENLYISYRNNKIAEINTADGTVGSLIGGLYSNEIADGTFSSNTEIGADALAFDKNNNLYYVDIGASLVRELSIQ
jgi:hypothetical protein